MEQPHFSQALHDLSPPTSTEVEFMLGYSHASSQAGSRLLFLSVPNSKLRVCKQ